MNAIGKAALLLAAFSALLNGQITFGAASVKAIPESVGWPPRAGYWISPYMENAQRFRALSKVSGLIEWAYQIRDFQLPGGPAWIKNSRDRFEVQATTATPSTEAEMRQMLQATLTERFHLKFHRETREFPVFALVPGPKGPAITAAADEAIGHGEGAVDIGNGVFRGRGVPISTLVRILSENLERPVIDQTGLTGLYDFTLSFDQTTLPDWRLAPAIPSLLKDLGLRIQPQKASFEVIVIDSIERPTEN